MKKVKKFFKRLGKTRFLMLFFIPFGAISFYHNGWLGLVAAIIGYSFGYWLCENKDRIKKFEFKKFFRRACWRRRLVTSAIGGTSRA